MIAEFVDHMNKPVSDLLGLGLKRHGNTTQMAGNLGRMGYDVQDVENVVAPSPEAAAPTQRFNMNFDI